MGYDLFFHVLLLLGWLCPTSVLGVATRSSRDGPDDTHARQADQDTFQSPEALSGAHPHAFL